VEASFRDHPTTIGAIYLISAFSEKLLTAVRETFYIQNMKSPQPNQHARMNRIVTKSLVFLAALSLAPMASAQSKPWPAGIIRFFSTYVSNPQDDPSWNNTNLDGVRLRPTWSDLAPTSSTYDWTSVDQIFAIAAEHGKFVGLSVAAGLYSPQWVYDAGAYQYQLHDGSGQTMTLPWDPVFQNKYFKFVRAMSRRYESNPSLHYIVITGLGQNVESYLSATAADDAALEALGGIDAWVGAAERIISVYARAFPTTPFFITAARVFTNDYDQVALQQVIDWAAARYPGRFGIMNATLNANSSTVYYPNEAIYEYRTTQPVGFQMLCSSINDPQRLGGTLQQALTAGVDLGAEYVEVYQSDADAPENQAVLATEGDALQANLPH
jgi:Beta-galactosidase